MHGPFLTSIGLLFYRVLGDDDRGLWNVGVACDLDCILTLQQMWPFGIIVSLLGELAVFNLVRTLLTYLTSLTLFRFSLKLQFVDFSLILVFLFVLRVDIDLSHQPINFIIAIFEYWVITFLFLLSLFVTFIYLFIVDICLILIFLCNILSIFCLALLLGFILALLLFNP